MPDTPRSLSLGRGEGIYLEASSGLFAFRFSHQPAHLPPLTEAEGGWRGYDWLPWTPGTLQVALHFVAKVMAVIPELRCFLLGDDSRCRRRLKKKKNCVQDCVSVPSLSLSELPNVWVLKV